MSSVNIKHMLVDKAGQSFVYQHVLANHLISMNDLFQTFMSLETVYDSVFFRCVKEYKRRFSKESFLEFFSKCEFATNAVLKVVEIQ